MNGFHITAIGWVLTFNSLALNRQAGHELYGLWADLLRARAEDLEKINPFLCLVCPRSMKLSDRTATAFGVLVNRMATLSPERFGCDVLRRRRDCWALQMVLGFLLWALAAEWLPGMSPLVTEIVVTLFLMSAGVVVPVVTLWRAASAAKYFRVKLPQEYVPSPSNSRNS